MNKRAAAPVFLLIEAAQGETVGVRFSSFDEARDWEDAHEGYLSVVGAVRIVTRREALAAE